MTNEERKVIWEAGYVQGYRTGMGYDNTPNPYERGTPEYLEWRKGAQQGYQDS